MADAYRDAPNRCPACGGVLHELPHSLACESCDGLFLSRSELESALFDVGATELQVSGHAASKLRCPRCFLAMETGHFQCNVVNGRAFGSKSVELIDDVPYCAQHGFWFSPEVFRRALALVGRRSNSWLRFGDHRFDG